MSLRAWVWAAVAGYWLVFVVVVWRYGHIRWHRRRDPESDTVVPRIDRPW
jgi:hypothetical protein